MQSLELLSELRRRLIYIIGIRNPGDVGDGVGVGVEVEVGVGVGVGFTLKYWPQRKSVFPC
jgi:hypothetical protein